jgi:hypothetical protein
MRTDLQRGFEREQHLQTRLYAVFVQREGRISRIEVEVQRLFRRGNDEARGADRQNELQKKEEFDSSALTSWRVPLEPNDGGPGGGLVSLRAYLEGFC